MFVSSIWWRKPTTLDITINEYNTYKILSTSGDQLNHIFKRMLLCKSNYFFFDDSDEDYLSKCQLIIKDHNGDICLNKIYSQIDNVNRRFFTNQYVYLLFDCVTSISLFLF